MTERYETRIAPVDFDGNFAVWDNEREVGSNTGAFLGGWLRTEGGNIIVLDEYENADRMTRVMNTRVGHRKSYEDQVWPYPR